MVCRKLSALCCALLMLAGCGASGQARAAEKITETMARPFTFSALVVLEGIEEPLGLSADKRADGLVLELTAPEELAGLRLEFAEEVTHLAYRELMMSLLPGDLPEQSVLAELRELLSQTPGAEAELVFRADEITVTGRAGMTPYTAVWSGDGAALESIFFPNSGTALTVADFAAAP